MHVPLLYDSRLMIESWSLHLLTCTSRYGAGNGGIDKNGSLFFGDGGFQGAEGHDTGAEWFVENVFEELDAPNEFYFDKAPNTLSNVYQYPSIVEVSQLLSYLVT